MNAELRQYWCQLRAWLDARAGAVRSITGILIASCVVLCMLIVPRTAPETVRENMFPGRRLRLMDLRRMEAALVASQLGDYRIQDGQLLAPVQEKARYFSALQEAGAMPIDFHEPTMEALRNSSLIESGSQRAARLQQAVENKARLAVCAIPGVEDALVHIDETETRSLQAERRITAIVAVQTAPDNPLDADTFRTIHDLVLRFKAGLHSDQITVIDLNGKKSFSGTIARQDDSLQARLLLRRTIEKQWQERLGEVLSFVPDARIVVYARPSAGVAEISDETAELRVSIGVPTSYLRQIQGVHDRSAARDSRERRGIAEETRRRIQAAIRPLLPGTPNHMDLQRMVTVTWFEDVPMVASHEASRSWFPVPSVSGNWLLGTGLVVGALVLIGWAGRQRLTAGRPAELRVYRDVTQPADNDAAEADDVTDAWREELETFVNDDPESAAKSLSRWIEKAS